MDPQVLLVLMSLAERGVALFGALQGVTQKVREKQEAGEEVTMDDLKQYVDLDDAARDELDRAIREAESGG